MYIVTVSFQIKPAHLAEFMPAMHANAQESVQSEPGCHQFDVCVAQNDPNQVFLYEVYESAEAFLAHQATSHFQHFNAFTALWVSGKTVKLFSRSI